MKNMTGKTGNRSKKVVPGKDFTKNYAVTLKDIDTSILNHIKNVIRPTVEEAGEVIRVPVLYANEERWKSVRKNGVLRDKNGAVMLPVITIRRTEVAFSDAIPMSFDNDLKGEFISVTRAKKWSKKNRYDRFSVVTGEQPTYDTIVSGMPDHVNCSYSIILFANYMEQANYLSELFLEHLGTYFGDSEDYKFLSDAAGGITSAIEMDAGGERFVKNEFSMNIRAYVIPEASSNIYGKTMELSKNITGPRKVVFGFEGTIAGGQSATSTDNGTAATGNGQGGSPGGKQSGI
tara:strand:- start:337 stop:1206 length:870 start_codon:yes stop_codon:yes gene_type:complete